MGTHRVCWAACAAVVVCALTASAQETRPFVGADLSSAGMMKRLEELRPALEAELGASFGERIVVHSVSRGEMGRIILEEAIPLAERIRGSPHGTALRALLEPGIESLGASAFAKVDIVDGKIYVVSENFRASARRPEIGPVALSQPFLDVILLHEATHVFQHRRQSLAQFLGAPASHDERGCLSAVIEGHAEYVAHHAAAHLGLADAAAAVRHAQSAVPASTREWSDARTLDFLRAYTLAPYVEGEVFVEQVVARIGRAAAFEHIFDHPPRARQELGDAGLYLDPAGRVFDAAACGARVKKLCTARKEPAEVAGLVVSSLRAELAPAGEDVAEAAVQGVRGGALVVAAPFKAAFNPSVELRVCAAATTDAAAATRLVAGCTAATKAVNAKLRAGQGGELTEESFEDAVLEGGAAVVASYRMKPERGPRRTTRVILARRGAAFVRVTATETDDTPEALMKLATDALDAVLAVAVAVPVDAESRPVAESRAAEVVVHGRVEWKVADQDGEKAKDEEAGPATFKLRFWTGPPDFRVVTVAGKDGSFEVTLPPGPTCRVGALFIDGARRVEAVGTKVKFDGSELILRLPRLESYRLKVIDADTKAPIADAQAWWNTPGYRPRGGVVLPGGKSLEAAAATADGSGMIELAATESGDEAVVVAAGHAFAAIDRKKLAAGDAPMVALAPGGDLRVVVNNWAKLVQPSLHLRALRKQADGDFELLYPADVDVRVDGTVLLRGLPVGTHVVVLRRGSGDGGTVLASAEVRVERGARAELTLDPVIDISAADCAITLVAPEGGGWSGDYEVALKPEFAAARGVTLEESARFTKTKQRVTVTFKQVPGGDYTLALARAHWSTRVTATGGPVEVALPKLATVVVRAVDAASGEPVAYFRIDRRRAAKDRNKWDFDERYVDSRDGLVTFRACPVAAEVRVCAEGFVDTIQGVDVALDGPNEVTVRVPPAGIAAVTVTGLDDKADESVYVELKQAGNENTERHSSAKGILTVKGLTPGRWTIDVGKHENYIAVAPVEFEVKAREATAVTLEVRKKKANE